MDLCITDTAGKKYRGNFYERGNRMENIQRDKLLKAFQKDARYKFRDLKTIIKGTNEQLTNLISGLRKEGYKIVHSKLDRTFYLSRIPTPYSDYYDLSNLPTKGRIGLISDTHLCSIAERVDLCEKAYDLFASLDISTVFHCGDISDGWRIYRNHQQFVKCIGAQNQAKYVIEHYPQRRGIKTYFIAGNHDNKTYESEGVDQCSLMVHGFVDFGGKKIDGRKDLVYLGQYSRYLLFPQEVTVQMLHPRGSNPYAKSYAQQKRAREMKTDTRPDIQFSGHMHTWAWIREDFCHMVALPGLQDETEFFVREGYGRQMGCCVMEYEIDKKRIRSLAIRYEVLD